MLTSPTDHARLAEEQAALRRVATLVADEAVPDVIFASVAEEIARILMADRCAMGRFEPDDSMTIVAYWSDEEPKVPVGTRIGLQGDDVTAAVRESRRPILIDDHEAFSGPLMDYARTLGSLPRSTVAAPIFVEGRVWGSIFASTMAVEIAEGTESRVVDFAELVATAIANTEARRELERVASEQRALRTAATLVASGASPSDVFSAITSSASELFEVPFASLLRFGPDEKATMIAGCAACSGFVGQSWTVPGDDPGIVRTVIGSRRPARIEDHSGVHGPLGEAARSLGIGSVVGVPVVVDGSVWGVLAVGAALDGPPLPADASDRLVGFTELVTTTLINAETRDSLRRLADEQAALRRVATLAARESSPAEVLEAVAEEAARVLDVDAIGMLRFELDETATLVAQSEAPWDPLPLGTCFTLEGENIVASVHRTGHTARMDDWEGATGSIAEMASVLGVRSTVASPIVVEGRLWGTMIAATNQSKPLRADTESRLVEFTELLAIAISNAESRGALRRLADEQAALRRVAVLVARGASPEEVFSAVADEVAGLFEVPAISLIRFEPDETSTAIAVCGEDNPFAVGAKFEPWPGVMLQVRRTGLTSRLEDFAYSTGPTTATLQKARIHSGVGVPINVEGEVWGTIIALATGGATLPLGIEERLSRFTELVATAISNAITRTDLLRSRARVVSAADETRRRLERDLHDGIQQWLVALALRARKAAGLSADGEAPVHELSNLADDLVSVTEELREISHGIHPAILSDAGLDDALEALARRSAVRVDLDVSFQGRYDSTLEATVYYVVAESITNAVKHARASSVAVHGGRCDGTIEFEIRDDGVGGADPRRGTGLIGLQDRVDTLGGTISLASPAGGGTTIRVKLPTSPRAGEGPPLRLSDDARSATSG